MIILAPQLLILDCDGVLIDSEAVASRIVARALSERGWLISAEDCEHRFIGKTLTDIAIEAEPITGPLGPDWSAEIALDLITALATDAEPMPGALDFVGSLVKLGIPFRVASNSSHQEMRTKFARTGFDRLIDQSRIHSAGDVMMQGGRGKPAPDLFFATAAAEGVLPNDAWVVEDSVAGVTAATAAGMMCYGFQPGHENHALTALGAIPLVSLNDLLPLLQPARCEAR